MAKPDTTKLNELKGNWRDLPEPEAGMPSLLWELWAQIEETYAEYRVVLLNAEKAMTIVGKSRPTMQERVDAFGRTVRAV